MAFHVRCLKAVLHRKEQAIPATPIPLAHQPWPQTRSQPQAANAMANAHSANPSAMCHRAQSVIAMIEYHSLATAMSRMNTISSLNLDKGIQPKRDLQLETFVDFQHKVEIWADSHDIRHFLGRESYGNNL